MKTLETDSNPANYFDKRGFAVDIVDKMDTEQHQTDQPRTQRVLVCVRCGARITYHEARISVSGQHAHEFTNPYGIAFLIGCFREAPGVATQGEATDFWSWFSDYCWQIGLCGGCQWHLGWRFANGADAFYGLMLDRLVEKD